jgi:hypothetical protein
MGLTNGGITHAINDQLLHNGQAEDALNKQRTRSKVLRVVPSGHDISSRSSSGVSTPESADVKNRKDSESAPRSAIHERDCLFTGEIKNAK